MKQHPALLDADRWLWAAAHAAARIVGLHKLATRKTPQAGLRNPERTTRRRTELGFLQGALQRMLVLLCKIHHLRDFRFGDFVSEDPANADTTLVDMQHDPGRIIHAHPEKALQAVNDELHRRVIVVQHQHLVKRGLARFNARAGYDAGAGAAITDISVVSVASDPVTGTGSAMFPGRQNHHQARTRHFYRMAPARLEAARLCPEYRNPLSASPRTGPEHRFQIAQGAAMVKAPAAPRHRSTPPNMRTGAEQSDGRLRSFADLRGKSRVCCVLLPP